MKECSISFSPPSPPFQPVESFDSNFSSSSVEYHGTSNFILIWDGDYFGRVGNGSSLFSLSVTLSHSLSSVLGGETNEFDFSI